MTRALVLGATAVALSRLDLPLGPLSALGEGQKSESASRDARSGRRLEPLICDRAPLPAESPMPRQGGEMC